MCEWVGGWVGVVGARIDGNHRQQGSTRGLHACACSERAYAGCCVSPIASTHTPTNPPPPGDVRVNWRSGCKASADVKAGDVISVAGRASTRAVSCIADAEQPGQGAGKTAASPLSSD